MNKSLSVDSLDLLRSMVQSEAWRIFESIQKEQIENLRVLATDVNVIAEKPYKAIQYAANAQGREDAITSLKDMLYDPRTESDGR